MRTNINDSKNMPDKTEKKQGKFSKAAQGILVADQEESEIKRPSQQKLYLAPMLRNFSLRVA
jgi:hypothetical protein